MKNIGIFTALLILTFSVSAQDTDSTSVLYKNAATQLTQSNSKLLIGGYGEVHYNQDISSETYENGNLDVHRIVMLFGYNFSHKTQFVTEIEFEHVKEVFVEQAYLQHKIGKNLRLQTGLLLVPMGITNQYHEPTTFNGVERPLIDSKIAPTTWREIGIGINGLSIAKSLKYELNIINGFNGYDGTAKLDGKNGLRGGRQKGAESYISSPNVAGRIEYYGAQNTNIGLSYYAGKTQSTLFDGLDKNKDEAITQADSSAILISMIGVDVRYNKKAVQCKGQLYYTNLYGTEAYNEFTGSDVASLITGYYFEVGYDILHNNTKLTDKIIPFARYENYNTHAKTNGTMVANDSYNVTAITTGLSWVPTSGTVLKADVLLSKSAIENNFSKTLNLGFGIFF